MTAFVPRLTAPSWTEPYWIKTTYGGYNRCIVIDSNTGLCVPNCTGWAWGRFCEAGGITDCNLSVGDGADFYVNTADGYQRGSTPKLGAVICFSGGSDGFGHVAIVEQINSNGTEIVCSESDYGGSSFYTNTRYLANNWVNQGSTTVFQGFIYNPYVTTGSGQLKLWMIKALLRRRKNEHKRTVLF